MGTPEVMAAMERRITPSADSRGQTVTISRLVLTMAMWLGRLEVLAVLVLFRAEVWRSARWHVS
jgi:Trk-type K+ transport system membrane component